MPHLPFFHDISLVPRLEGPITFSFSAEAVQPALDVINGGPGDDVLPGTDDPDTIFGGAGDDTILGGAAKTSCGDRPATTAFWAGMAMTPL